MKLTGKAANWCFLFLFALIFASPLFAESPSGEEALLSEEPATGEEALLSEEPAAGGDTFLSGDPSLDDEALLEEEYALLFEGPSLVFEAPVFELRSLDEIFPGFSADMKDWIIDGPGLRNSFEKDGSPTLIPARNSGIELLSGVMRKNPSHIIEALVIIPYGERELDMLDIYNALGRIKNIQEQTIPLKSGNSINIFMDTTRLEGAKNRKPVADPSPANYLPFSETMYLRFTDAYVGDLYIRGDISLDLHGITYSMTNYLDVRYSLFRIMRAERFSAYLYLEPIKEGILIYSMSGIYLPGFISKMINLTPNINARITALLNWITDGLRKQETIRRDPHYTHLLYP